ncbi:hypothetical protein CR105_16250 [Massilia eurypsychrophila]|uniref:DUF4123 domain-containing protein n=1 Tax=Massilia eurypsychrophila TaxID=1485217 RepID=A0A2G8TD55_9BURK|nr:DUF4123 domain-containing protein [Massilia eurypsychrophila]PIL43899.1 hypothetical protein CR105_16250 [Massilia eurypsychrophila]
MLTSQSLRDVHATHANKHPNDFFYLLVDHAGMPGLHRELQRSKIEWVSLFEGTTQVNALSVAPLLVCIQTRSPTLRDDWLLRWICETGAYSSSLMLIASRLSMRVLAERLTARLDAKISEDMDVLLRYFDPRVFEQMVRVLSVEQLASFFSVASAWWYVNRIGELQAVEAQFSEIDAFGSPLMLSARQEHELVEASEIDQIEEQLRRSVPDEFARLVGAERHRFLVRHIDAAREFRITSTRELILYCALALVYGPDFSTRPEWAPKLDLIREGKNELSDVVASLNESSIYKGNQ